MPRCNVANNGDDRTTRFLGIVKVRHGVSESQSHVQETRSRLSAHPRIPVARTGADGFVQSEHRSNARLRCEGLDQPHFSGSWIDEANADPCVCQCLDNDVGSSLRLRHAKTVLEGSAGHCTATVHRTKRLHQDTVYHDSMDA